MLSETNEGVNFFQPVFAPVFAAPLGSHFMVEGRFDLDGYFIQNNRTGPYEGQLFKSTQILQLDYVANSKLTIQEHVPGITSLNYTLNAKVNDTIYDQEVICYAGKDHIEEKLEHFRFKISPKSFFQTNTYQAEALYRVTREFAGLTGAETLYDLYCGTGSIGIFCSGGAKKVIGIELIPDAIKDAYENAAMNGITHCEFFAGDVEKICTDAFFTAHGRPDVIITDPPRAGMTEKLINQLLKMRAPKVVYVSCNPATQARDLQLLDAAYRITRLQPLDMFPHTHHIENVALLELRG